MPKGRSHSIIIARFFFVISPPILDLGYSPNVPSSGTPLIGVAWSALLGVFIFR
ncbi:MAG: hypothetical protein Q8Q10_01155 [bacterium]|nr:hypothetical protein [bacterium]